MVSSIVAFKGVVHFYWLLTCICSKRSSAWFWEDKRNLLTDSRKCLIWFLVLRQSSMEFGKQMRSLSLTQDHTFHPQSGCVEFNQRKKWSPCSIIFPINFKQRLYRLCVCNHKQSALPPGVHHNCFVVTLYLVTRTIHHVHRSFQNLCGDRTRAHYFQDYICIMQSCLCEILAICVCWITYDHEKLNLRMFIRRQGVDPALSTG